MFPLIWFYVETLLTLTARVINSLLLSYLLYLACFVILYWGHCLLCYLVLGSLFALLSCARVIVCFVILC